LRALAVAASSWAVMKTVGIGVPARGQLLLEVEAAHSAQVDVQHETGRCSRRLGGQELLRGRERDDRESRATQETPERPQE
jgi:hypothetical protein